MLELCCSGLDARCMYSKCMLSPVHSAISVLRASMCCTLVFEAQLRGDVSASSIKRTFAKRLGRWLGVWESVAALRRCCGCGCAFVCTFHTRVGTNIELARWRRALPQKDCRDNQMGEREGEEVEEREERSRGG